MPGDAGVIGLLQRINHGLAESGPATRVTFALSSRRRSQGLFDRLDQDIHGIERRGAIGAHPCIELGHVITNECRSRGDLGGVWSRDGYIERATVAYDLVIEALVAGHAFAAGVNRLREPGDRPHLLLNDLAACGVVAAEV